MLSPRHELAGWAGRFGAICLIAWSLLGSGGFSPLSADDAIQSKEQIERWVSDLGSPKYIVREVAMEKLLGAGIDAIGPLAKGIEGGNLEVVSRGVRVLRELAVSGDDATEVAAFDALKSLAADSGTAAGRRATETLAGIDQLRQTRAVVELKKLGATIEAASVRFGQAGPAIMIETVITIEINDSWQGGEKGLANLRWLHEVEQVIFQGQKVEAAWLPYLQKMPKLRVVQIKRTKLTDADMARLTGLKDLQQLGIFYTPITDKAVDSLKKMIGLGDLRLIGTDITDDGRSQLEAALANTSVDYRRGAFVGVGCDPTAANCFVTQVQPKSAAERAGLQVGDEIISYDGKKVTDFNSLRDLIQKNKAGDTVKIEINRDSDTLTKTLELGEWD